MRKSYPRLPVIMFSTLTERGADATLERSLRAPPTTSPSPPTSAASPPSMDAVRDELHPQDQVLWRRPLRPAADARPRRIAARARCRATRRRGPVDVVAIGVSTGGPNALTTVVAALPGDLAGARRHRPAHAADVHRPARRAAHGKSAASRSSRRGDRDARRGRAASDRPRRLPHDASSATPTRCASPPRPGAAGELVPPRGRRAVPLGRSRSTAPRARRWSSPAWATTALAGRPDIVEAGGAGHRPGRGHVVVWGMPGAIVAAGTRRPEVLPMHRRGASCESRGASPRDAHDASTSRRVSPGMSARPDDFEFVCDLVRERSAIVLEAGKEYLVEARLAPARPRAGPRSSPAGRTSCARTRAGRCRDQVIEAMTTNETSFFRDVHPFEALPDQGAPRRSSRRGPRRAAPHLVRRVSTGQEPYSIAMTHSRALSRARRPGDQDPRDRPINPTMLARARPGVLRQLEVNRGLPASLLVKHFEKHGADWQIEADIRQMIESRSSTFGAMAARHSRDGRRVHAQRPHLLRHGDQARSAASRAASPCGPTAISSSAAPRPR